MYHWRFVIGANQLSRLGTEVEVHMPQKVIVHGQYEKDTETKDIALVRLNMPVTFSDYIQPACLPRDTLDMASMGHCHVSGWGVMEANEYNTADVLQEAQVDFIPHEVCNSVTWYNGAIGRYNLCARYKREPTDSCQGDSGGPLMCQDPKSRIFFVVGVTSWGKGCGRPQKPGVYSSTLYFLKWILNTIKEDMQRSTSAWIAAEYLSEAIHNPPDALTLSSGQNPSQTLQQYSFPTPIESIEYIGSLTKPTSLHDLQQGFPPQNIKFITEQTNSISSEFQAAFHVTQHVFPPTNIQHIQERAYTTSHDFLQPFKKLTHSNVVEQGILLKNTQSIEEKANSTSSDFLELSQKHLHSQIVHQGVHHNIRQSMQGQGKSISYDLLKPAQNPSTHQTIHQGVPPKDYQSIQEEASSLSNDFLDPSLNTSRPHTIREGVPPTNFHYTQEQVNFITYSFLEPSQNHSFPQTIRQGMHPKNPWSTRVQANSILHNFLDISRNPSPPQTIHQSVPTKNPQSMHEQTHSMLYDFLASSHKPSLPQMTRQGPPPMNHQSTPKQAYSIPDDDLKSFNKSSPPQTIHPGVPTKNSQPIQVQVNSIAYDFLESSRNPSPLQTPHQRFLPENPHSIQVPSNYISYDSLESSQKLTPQTKYHNVLTKNLSIEAPTNSISYPFLDASQKDSSPQALHQDVAHTNLQTVQDQNLSMYYSVQESFNISKAPLSIQLGTSPNPFQPTQETMESSNTNSESMQQAGTPTYALPIQEKTNDIPYTFIERFTNKKNSQSVQTFYRQHFLPITQKHDVIVKEPPSSPEQPGGPWSDKSMGQQIIHYPRNSQNLDISYEPLQSSKQTAWPESSQSVLQGFITKPLYVVKAGVSLKPYQFMQQSTTSSTPLQTTVKSSPTVKSRYLRPFLLKPQFLFLNPPSASLSPQALSSYLPSRQGLPPALKLPMSRPRFGKNQQMLGKVTT